MPASKSSLWNPRVQGGAPELALTTAESEAGIKDRALLVVPSLFERSAPRAHRYAQEEFLLQPERSPS